jgi:hypothetical protein
MKNIVGSNGNNEDVESQFIGIKESAKQKSPIV